MAREGNHDRNRSVNHLHNCRLAHPDPGLERAECALVGRSPPLGARGGATKENSLNESQQRQISRSAPTEQARPHQR